LRQIARERTSEDIDLFMRVTDTRDGLGFNLDMWDVGTLGQIPRDIDILAAVNREDIPERVSLKTLAAKIEALAARVENAGF